MKTPIPLRKGDLIALASPARKISREELLPAMQILEEAGFSVRMDEEIFLEDHQYAGTDDQRAAHFQRLMDDPSVKAILCSRGGYGSMRLLGKLDFSQFVHHPKWIAGYSDITALHAHLHQMGIKSLHSTMPVNFAGNTSEALQSLFDALKGKNHHTLNRKGTAEGILTGGNLSILYSLAGSADFPDLRGKILFIEDLDEYLYHIDRMMLSLKRTRAFDGLAGLIVGGLTEMKDNAVPFGKSAEEIVNEHIAEYSFPVCF
ncbi:MAG: LD-carboxypeptidase, partial [Deltaproteobacteria bacterium]|nr:LD-carboxypeptidase [Deltaproteobacteria bacterium]